MQSLVAHQDAVASIDFDPSGMYLLSGGVSCAIPSPLTSTGHDRSVRMWDVGTRQCVYEITTHRLRYNEAIHAAKFHPTQPVFARPAPQMLVCDSFLQRGRGRCGQDIRVAPNLLIRLMAMMDVSQTSCRVGQWGPAK